PPRFGRCSHRHSSRTLLTDEKNKRGTWSEAAGESSIVREAQQSTLAVLPSADPINLRALAGDATRWAPAARKGGTRSAGKEHGGLRAAAPALRALHYSCSNVSRCPYAASVNA